MATAEQATAEADIVVTASRSPTALFSGDLLKPGSFAAAVGSSLPSTRELDDRAIARASLVAVEWRDQSLREAGDLALADPAALPRSKIVELGEILAGKARGRATDQEITVYKSVGVGLQDIALAGWPTGGLWAARAFCGQTESSGVARMRLRKSAWAAELHSSDGPPL